MVPPVRGSLTLRFTFSITMSHSCPLLGPLLQSLVISTEYISSLLRTSKLLVGLGSSRHSVYRLVTLELAQQLPHHLWFSGTSKSITLSELCWANHIVSVVLSFLCALFQEIIEMSFPLCLLTMLLLLLSAFTVLI